MKQIKKIDYFVGVFLSAILSSANSVPALFDETDDSKRVEFDTNIGKFNVYVKYSTTKKESRVTLKGKQKTYWYIPFSEKEYDKFKNFKKDDGYNNYLALVCTNSTYSKTWIAVLDYDKSMQCLGNATPKGSRRITIMRFGNAHTFECTGVGLKNNVECQFDFTTYFSESSVD